MGIAAIALGLMFAVVSEFSTSTAHLEPVCTRDELIGRYEECSGFIGVKDAKATWDNYWVQQGAYPYDLDEDGFDWPDS